MGGRKRPEIADRIFKRHHTLEKPSLGDAKPIFIVDNPSRDFYFPIDTDDIRTVLNKLPTEHTQHLTHIWLRKMKKLDYEKGDTTQGCFICGSGVSLIVLHPFPIDNKMRLGKCKPVQRLINYYKQYNPILRQDNGGWYLLWTEESIRKYYLETLLLHEIAHSIESFYQRFWSKARKTETEDFADNYAAFWYSKRKHCNRVTIDLCVWAKNTQNAINNRQSTISNKP